MEQTCIIVCWCRCINTLHLKNETCMHQNPSDGSQPFRASQRLFVCNQYCCSSGFVSVHSALRTRVKAEQQLGRLPRRMSQGSRCPEEHNPRSPTMFTQVTWVHKVVSCQQRAVTFGSGGSPSKVENSAFKTRQQQCYVSRIGVLSPTFFRAP